MEGREIYNQIMHWPSVSSQWDVLEERLKVLSKNFEKLLDNNEFTHVIFDKVIADNNKESVITQWKIFDDSLLTLELTREKISYGFQLSINSNKFNHNFDLSLVAITKRYFSNFEIIKSTSKGMIVKSHYSVGSRQLNSRDFENYSVFVYMKALQMAYEIFRINAIETLKIAV